MPGFYTLPGNKLRIPAHRWPEGHNIHNIRKAVLKRGLGPKIQTQTDAVTQHVSLHF